MQRRHRGAALVVQSVRPVHGERLLLLLKLLRRHPVRLERGDDVLGPAEVRPGRAVTVDAVGQGDVQPLRVVVPNHPELRLPILLLLALAFDRDVERVLDRREDVPDAVEEVARARRQPHARQRPLVHRVRRELLELLLARLFVRDLAHRGRGLDDDAPV